MMTLELAQRLAFEDLAYLALLLTRALAQNQLADFHEQRRRRLSRAPVPLRFALHIGQRRELVGGQLQELRHLLVDVGAFGGGRQFLPIEQLRDIRLGHFRRLRQIPLFQIQLFQALFDENGHVHRALLG